MEKRWRLLGLLGVVSLLSYAAMVLFSPLAYPGYDWLSMAVSDLGAVGAPSKELADRLSTLYSPCAIVSVMAVWAGIAEHREKLLRAGAASFAAMEWVSKAGYSLFPWVRDGSAALFQNRMHLVVTVLVVVLSIAALALIAIGARREHLRGLSNWAIACLAAMAIGAFGTGVLPKTVFGLFERLSAFSAVVFNAVLGWHLYKKKI